MSLFRVARFALPVLALSGFMTATAAADDHRLYFSSERSNQLPGCDASSVQRAVQNTVSRAPSYFNGVRIVQLDKIRDTTYRSSISSAVTRRYCSGTASLSDGSRVAVKYLLEAHAGAFGISWNVETCLNHRDKWYVYGGSCRTLTAQ